MKRTDLEAMKVAELKKLTKEHGLTLESKGHKFNKTELIDRLVTLKDVTEETKTEDQVKDFENLAKKVSVASDEEEAWDEPLTQENKEAAKQEGIETKEE